jgi:hypothetical protein
LSDAETNFAASREVVIGLVALQADRNAPPNGPAALGPAGTVHLNVADWARFVTLTHAGSNTLWFAVVWLAPEIDFAVLVAGNAASEDVAKTCDAVAGELIRGFAPSARGERDGR